MNKKTIYILIFLIGNQLYGEKVNFDSLNPFSFRDIILNLDDLEKQNVYGILTLPNSIPNVSFPLILGVAGSLGWKQHHLDHMKIYREMGFATFELKSFESRGVTSTVGSQVEVTTAMLILDSYRALDALSAHPKIDKNRIAITGWSLGGGTTLFSGWIPLIEAINPSNRFSAHLSYYPPCIAQPEKLLFTDAPMHILIGEVDDWTPANSCVELVQNMLNEGIDINITVYKDSHHSFDSILPITEIESGYSLTDCSFKIRSDGSVLMNFLNIPMAYPLLQKIGLSFCADRGTTLGGNQKAREKSLKFSKTFMQNNLQN